MNDDIKYVYCKKDVIMDDNGSIEFSIGRCYKVLDRDKNGFWLENNSKDNHLVGCINDDFFDEYFSLRPEFRDEMEIPKHYDNGNKYDVIDFCKDYNLNFNRGNVVKYIARAGKKEDELKDLKKALDYINREIEFISKKQ
jgi:hypothetical protein